MHSEDGIHALQSALLHILLRLAANLLGHLEDELDGALQLLPVVLKHAGGPQEHGGVAVVAAGVHHARVEAAVALAGVLLDGEGVYVRPEHDGFTGLTALNGGHAAGNTLKGLDGDSHAVQLLLDEAGGFHLLGAQLRVGVKPAAALNDVGLLFFRQRLNIHHCAPPAFFAR